MKYNKFTSILFILVFLVFLPCTLSAAKYDDLTNDCKGQYLYLSHGNIIVEFISLGNNGKWICLNLDNGILFDLSPDKATIIPIYADGWDFDIISFAAGYAIPDSQNPLMSEELLKVYSNLLKYRASPRGTKLRKCLEYINVVYANVDGNVIHANSGKKSALDNIIEILQKNQAVDAIHDAISDGDYQIAIPCYCRYRQKITELLYGRIPAAYFRDAKILLNDLSEELLTSYRNSRDNCKVRVNQFLSCFPNSYGVWTQDNPVNDDELRRFYLAIFDNFQKTLEYSEYTEFPQWGPAMLAVLQLFPVDGIIAKEAAHFDECLKQYKTKYQQTK